MLDMKVLLTKILTSIKTLQTGKQASLGVSTIAWGWLDTSNVPSGSYIDRTVTFGKTFSNNPYVVASFTSQATAGAFGRCTCAVHSITTTGCKIRVFNGDSTQRSPGLYWIAIR